MGKKKGKKAPKQAKKQDKEKKANKSLCGCGSGKKREECCGRCRLPC